MMLKLSNIRIGTKLTIISILSILLVAGMIGGQLLGNSSVKSSNELANFQQQIARDSMTVRALETRMQLGVRDVRLARTPENLQRALSNIDESLKAAVPVIDSLIERLRIPENRERVQKVRSLAEQYASGAKELAAMQSEIIEISGSRAADAMSRLAALTDQRERFARERTLPIAAQLDELTEKIRASASNLAEKEIAAAAQEMKTSERVGLAIGLLAIVILIGSAVFGTMAIARPLKRMAAVLVELTNDRIVDVPYTARGDEIGEIAKATEVFKNSIAEKVINLRVRSALDVVRSNVMVADDQYNIMYMNTTLQGMLREAESELRKVLPSFDSSKLLGANMDVFHKNPAHQRRILDQLTGSYETHITVGTQKFHLVATAVIDSHGRRVGTVVEWRNETAEKAIEAEVDELVQAAVAGDFSRRVPLDGKRDFMLNLAKSMNALCENIAKVMDDLVGMFGALADGDFRRRITADYQGSFGKLKTDANAMADRIGTTIAEIKAAAREVSNASAEISASTTDLSQRTEEQAASLEETSASMEEISATVKKNAENAQQANESAGSTRDVATRGGEVVAKAVDAMARIEESSRKISDIIGVIDEIARQTNLLALNAAVEAARAGEAGRGFAVVASEVRSLAQRSSQAAKDIKDLIISSNAQVKDGVDLVNRAGTALDEIVESIKKVAAVVSDIAAASVEQSAGIEQVNKALAQMDEVTQQNSALVEENAATAKTLEQQAKAMDERVAFFRIDDAQDTGRITHMPRTVAAVARPDTSHKQTAMSSAAPAPKKSAATRRGPVGKMQTALATAFQDDPDWREF
jgi:methyl-accepting chemotaxis protein